MTEHLPILPLVGTAHLTPPLPLNFLVNILCTQLVFAETSDRQYDVL
jgi:hypothetical protein